MKKLTFTYDIGDVVKARKNAYLEKYQDRPMFIMGKQKTYGVNEYKVIVCGYENQFLYFLEEDIEGKI